MTYRLSELGRRIREERTAKGLSLEKLAKKAGTSKGYLWQIEKAKANPSFLLVYDIAHVLKISLKKLF